MTDWYIRYPRYPGPDSRTGRTTYDAAPTVERTTTHTPLTLQALRESRTRIREAIQRFEFEDDGEEGTDMANAHALDDIPLNPARSKGRDNLTMLQIDDVCADLVHLGLVPLDDHAGIPGIDDAHDAQVEVEPADEQIEIVLDMEGVSTDDPVRLYLREICRVSLLTAAHEVAMAKRMERGECLGAIIGNLEDQYGFTPPSEVVCLEMYENLVSNWPLLEEIYFAQYSEKPPTSRHKLLSAIAPGDNVDPS